MLTIAGAVLIAANVGSTTLVVVGGLCIVGALWAFGAWGALWRGLREATRWGTRRVRREAASLPHAVTDAEDLMRTSEPLPLPERLVAFYREGERLRASIAWSILAIPGDLVHGTANQRQVAREQLARDWDGRVLAALRDDSRPDWIAAATLAEHKLDPASTIVGVRGFLATKLACLKEIIRELPFDPPAPSPRSGELSSADRIRIARETEARIARTIHDPTLRALDASSKAAAQPEHALKAGNDLLRLILQAELQDTPSAKAREILYHNLAATVEAWVRGIGSTEEVQRASGDPGADLARLKVLVQSELARVRVRQEQK